MRIHENEHRLCIKFEKLRTDIWDLVYEPIVYDAIFYVACVITHPSFNSVFASIKHNIQINYGFKWH